MQDHVTVLATPHHNSRGPQGDHHLQRGVTDPKRQASFQAKGHAGRAIFVLVPQGRQSGVPVVWHQQSHRRLLLVTIEVIQAPVAHAHVGKQNLAAPWAALGSRPRPLRGHVVNDRPLHRPLPSASR